jgi:deazaflavin-dependent oxidoreductase (nitroreductase family)
LPLIYGRSGEDYVIVASRGGHPTHPGWYHNLGGGVRVGVQVCGDRFEATARDAKGEDRERLWKMMAELFPPYDAYQTKAAPREIPVVVLRRAS